MATGQVVNPGATLSTFGLIRRDETPTQTTTLSTGGEQAALHVTLPAEATLTVQGEPTTATGAARDFVSPPLPPVPIRLFLSGVRHGIGL